MRPSDLSYLTIAELEPLLRQRQLSPVELVGACLARIHALEGKQAPRLHNADGGVGAGRGPLR